MTAVSASSQSGSESTSSPSMSNSTAPGWARGADPPEPSDTGGLRAPRPPGARFGGGSSRRASMHAHTLKYFASG